MSPKGKHKKNYRKDESSDVYVEDKQFEKKKDRKDKKKKDRKDESSDIHVDDMSLKKPYFDDNQQTEFVYFDPSIIQEADVFQAPSQQSHVSHENDEVEAVDYDLEAIEQYFDVEEQEAAAVDNVVEAKKQDEMKE
jgi:hypothetical protein